MSYKQSQLADFEKQNARQAVWKTPPSKRKRPHWVSVPPPLIDLWRVFYNNAGKYTLICFCFDVDQAYAEADKVWERLSMNEKSSVRIDHKGALVIQGKVYLVNVLPIKVMAPPSEDTLPASTLLVTKPVRNQADEEWIENFFKEKPNESSPTS
jgi:hypothetical protein